MAGEAAETAQDIFSLSDEDFAALSEPTLTEVSDEESTLTDTAEVEETDVAEDVQEESEEEHQEDSGAEEIDEDTPEEALEAAEDTEQDVEDNGEPDTGEIDEPEINYKQEYEKLLATFKANGKDMKVDSVEDARRLMQMGANYNKKMSGLKPNLKHLKLLEKHQLLSEEKLSFLIDLNEGNPEAIKKLLTDSKIDPMDLNLEEAIDYQPSPRKVDDKEVELDTVLEELRDSETYDQTLDVVGTQWDSQSKQIVADQPQLLKVIDGHIASGVYNLISTEVERERVFGRLSGVSDIEAYRQIGDAMQEKGAFDHLFSKETVLEKSPMKAAVPKPKAVDDTKRRDKRRAASPSKPAAPSAGKADYNPLGMSDEEFMQLDPSLI
tara:strand:+ start:3221 stop:4363 length:1143 start_codon:yes stop_codon:yes gene_type:complete